MNKINEEKLNNSCPICVIRKEQFIILLLKRLKFMINRINLIKILKKI